MGELLLIRPVQGPQAQARQWWALGRPAAALQPGRQVITAAGTCLDIVARQDGLCAVAAAQPLWPVLQAEGCLPLPPYIASRGAADAQDYQTIFAARDGAVAAPTASLHFTPAVLTALQAAGVQLLDVVLHVGPGTFLPVRREHMADARQHRMHTEAYEVPAATLAAAQAARAAGRRVVAAGTTALRALETAANSGQLKGESELFIYPGYAFQLCNALLTNFHLPKSTLLLLVAAMAGRQRIMAAYAEAMQRGYRFYSYGDAMLIR